MKYNEMENIYKIVIECHRTSQFTLCRVFLVVLHINGISIQDLSFMFQDLQDSYGDKISNILSKDINNILQVKLNILNYINKERCFIDSTYTNTTFKDIFFRLFRIEINTKQDLLVSRVEEKIYFYNRKEYSDQINKYKTFVGFNELNEDQVKDFMNLTLYEKNNILFCDEDDPTIIIRFLVLCKSSYVVCEVLKFYKMFLKTHAQKASYRSLILSITRISILIKRYDLLEPLFEYMIAQEKNYYSNINFFNLAIDEKSIGIIMYTIEKTVTRFGIVGNLNKKIWDSKYDFFWYFVNSYSTKVRYRALDMIPEEFYLALCKEEDLSYLVLLQYVIYKYKDSSLFEANKEVLNEKSLFNNILRRYINVKVKKTIQYSINKNVFSNNHVLQEKHIQHIFDKLRLKLNIKICWKFVYDYFLLNEVSNSTMVKALQNMIKKSLILNLDDIEQISEILGTF